MAENETRQSYHFGSYLLEPSEHRLSRKGRMIHLRPKSHELLVYLLENRGHLVSKDAILEAVWPETHVTESTLATSIWEIREAIEDHGDHARFIETVPKVGYQFVGSVQATSADATLAKSRLSIAIALALCALVVALGLWYIGWLVPRDQPVYPDIDSIAVLPFMNVTGDDESGSLAFGIPAAVGSSLARQDRLKVKPAAALVRYRGKEIDPQTVSEEQGVSGVLIGSVERRGNNLTVTVNLIDGRDNTEIWGQTYRRKTSDIFAVQEDIARQVVEALRLRLTDEESERMAQTGTQSPEAYLAFLRGGYRFDRWVTAAGDYETVYADSIKYFEEAIELDPNYQEAYYQLARTHFARARNTSLAEEDYARAREFRERLIAVDNSTVLAHRVRAQTLWQYDRNWVEADLEYRRAVELDPSFETDWWFLKWMGRLEEVKAGIEPGLKTLDPLSASQQISAGYDLLYQRDYDRAIEQAIKGLALESESVNAYEVLSEAYQQLEMEEKAFRALVTAERMRGTTEEETAGLSRYFEESGLQGLTRWKLDRQLTRQSHPRPEVIAGYYARLDEMDKAFEWLEKAWSTPLWGNENAPSSFFWDPIRDDPRFEQLLRGQNLPEEAIQNHLVLR